MMEQLTERPTGPNRKGRSLVPDKKKPWKRPGRLKLWEIDRSLRCPITGMCLTFAEQKRMLKKVVAEPYGKTPFDIHEIIVGSSENENPLSRKLDGFLGRRFAGETRALHALSEEAFMRHWRDSFQKGEWKGILWAGATRPGLSGDSVREIYGTVHMAMHGSAEREARLRRELSRQKRKVETLMERFKEEVRCRRALRKKMTERTRTLGQTTLRPDVSEEQEESFDDSAKRVPNARSVSESEEDPGRREKALRVSEERAAALERQVALLEKRNRELDRRIREQEALIADFERETRMILEKWLQLQPCDAGCPSFDLCRKRILIVGGMTRLETFYRRVVEGSGGIFEYHDGYLKRGSRQLENKLKRADVVLCPVNCNSHAACSVVKNLCKKHDKPVYMMANSSLNAVTQAIIGSIP